MTRRQGDRGPELSSVHTVQSTTCWPVSNNRRFAPCSLFDYASNPVSIFKTARFAGLWHPIRSLNFSWRASPRLRREIDVCGIRVDADYRALSLAGKYFKPAGGGALVRLGMAGVVNGSLSASAGRLAGTQASFG